MNSVCEVDWSAVGGMTSAAMAFIAVCLTIWQTRVTRTHNKLSVKPLLKFYEGRENAGDVDSCLVRYRLYLHNHGLGLATVQNISFHVDGKKVETLHSSSGPAHYAHIKLFSRRSRQVMPQEIVGGIIPAGKECNVLEYLFDVGDIDPSLECRDVKNRLRVHVEYESMYHEKFSCQYPDPTSS